MTVLTLGQERSNEVKAQVPGLGPYWVPAPESGWARMKWSVKALAAVP